MTQYATIITDNMVMVCDTANGKDIKLFKDDEGFAKAVDLIKLGKAGEVFKFDKKTVVTSFFEGKDDWGFASVKIENGVGKIILHKFNDFEAPLADAIVKKIMKMHEQGFSCRPLLNFVYNLYQNPSPTAIQELFLFIEACDLPITEDGHFIAYKMVRENYKDIYSGKMDNSIGATPSMPRSMVDDDRNRTCSCGLHFCSKAYLPCYMSSNASTDRCVLVKINPADVVAIPADYNNAKGRTWQYTVVGEIPSGWRETLPHKDYTDHAVVDNNGAELPQMTAADLTMAELCEKIDASDFWYDSTHDAWYEGDDYVDMEDVAEELGVSIHDLAAYEMEQADLW